MDIVQLVEFFDAHAFTRSVQDDIEQIKPCLKPGFLLEHQLNNLFIIACECGYIHIVKYLLENTNADPSAIFYQNTGWNGTDNAAIRMASMNGHADVVRVLLETHRCDPSSCNNESLRHAALSGHLEIMKLLLMDDRVDPADPKSDALIKAVRGRHRAAVQYLLTFPTVDPTSLDCTVLKLAAKHSDLILFRVLLASIIKRGYHIDDLPLDEAAACENVAILDTVLAMEGVDPSRNGNSAFFSAVGAGRVGCVNRLMEVCQITDSASIQQAFSLACQNGHFNLFALLVEAGRGNQAISSHMLQQELVRSLNDHQKGVAIELMWIISKDLPRPRRHVDIAYSYNLSSKSYPCWKATDHFVRQRIRAVSAIIVTERIRDCLPVHIWDHILIMAWGRRFGHFSLSSKLRDINCIRARLSASRSTQ